MAPTREGATGKQSSSKADILLDAGLVDKQKIEVLIWEVFLKFELVHKLHFLGF